MTTLLIFGRDLRLADNPAVEAAVTRGKPVIPVYLHDPEDAGPWASGAASAWWLHHSLASLARDLTRAGSRLVLRKGTALREIPRLVKETGADAVFWNRRYEPWAVTRGAALKSALGETGIEARSFNAGLLHEPQLLKTQAGKPYTVFTPFWKALRATLALDAARAAPKHIPAPAHFPASDDPASWNLLPHIAWDAGFKAAWSPGEAGAQRRLADFLDNDVLAYGDRRNFPGQAGTSRLSPHLHFGEIGPRQIWRAAIAQGIAATGDPMPRGVEVFLSEIAWREFSYHLLFHHPDMPAAPLRKNFAAFPWRSDAAHLKAWQKGLTGYPIVDAGMRELWHTGWMHNRVRMIVASFLIKHLLLPWQDGECWFWDTLVDADLASNAASWQSVAGCGADAAPYFRIFNPVTQGVTYDPDGAYVRRWVPEIAKLPDARLHQPWTATPMELADAGVRLGTDYPLPIVDHSAARQRALAAFQDMKTA
ncbi:MAG: deoxyribodipyrimidine photo-lyase [Rhodospirillaceae bacterium]